MTGDKRQVHGLHYWHATVRGSLLPYSRVTLAVAHVSDVKGEYNSEADIAVGHLTRIAKKLPGAQAFLGATALRGVHIVLHDTQRRGTELGHLVRVLGPLRTLPRRVTTHP